MISTWEWLKVTVKLSNIAKGVTVMAAEAFIHPTNPVKFKIEVNKPVFLTIGIYQLILTGYL